MKKQDRLVYLELAKEINAGICTFCKYAEWESEGCCEGYNVCQQEMAESPSSDCWGFRPNMSIPLICDLVSAVLTQGYEEWAFIRYSPTQLTVYGRSYERNSRKEKSGKVRIGYKEVTPLTK